MFTINSGEFRDRIYFRRLKKSDSVLVDDEYVDIYSCRAKVKGLGGNEFLTNDSIEIKQTYNFIIRKNRKFDIKNSDIIIYKNKEFNIEYINDCDLRYVELKGVEI